MKQLTGLDSLFLNLESARWPMHGAGIAVLDPSTAPEGFTFETLRRTIAERLHLLPPLRWRLVEVPFRFAQPYWIEDPDFDLANHLHRVAVPAPGGARELALLASEISDRPLDHSRPLWELWYVDGLEHGQVAIIEKLHHASVDGMGGIELITRLFDTEAEPAERPSPEAPWKPDRVPSGVELFARGVPSLVTMPLRFARGTVTIANGVRSGRRQKRHEAGTVGRTFNAPRTSLNGSVAGRPHRALAWATIPMADVTLVKQAFDVTVNDVALAICATALREYLGARGELPAESLTACAPVNIRTEDDRGRAGVHVSLMFPSLCTDIEDPVERLLAISEGTTATKHVHGARGLGTVQTIVGLPTPAAWEFLGQVLSLSHAVDRIPPIFNVCISNIAGPTTPLYMGGARLVSHHVTGMLFEGVGLFIPLMSYADSIDLGITAVRELVPDPWELAEGVERALDELRKAADAVTG